MVYRQAITPFDDNTKNVNANVLEILDEEPDHDEMVQATVEYIDTAAYFYL